MGKYWILRTETFIDDYNHLPKWEQSRIERFAEQLSQVGGAVGKPLGCAFFLEKKFNGNRMYYLAYEECFVVLLVRISTKKEQAITIAEIKQNFEAYRKMALDFAEKTPTSF